MRAVTPAALVTALTLSECVRLPVLTSPAPVPSADDGVVVNSVRRPDDALYQVYLAMIAHGLSVDPAPSRARRLEARSWTIGGDTTIAVEAIVIDTQSPPMPTVVVLSATWSSASARLRRRPVTNRDAPSPWAAFQRLGDAVRAALKP